MNMFESQNNFNWSVLPVIWWIIISQYWFINGLMPNRRQVIAWTIDGPVHWRIYASFGLHMLRLLGDNSFWSFWVSSTLEK